MASQRPVDRLAGLAGQSPGERLAARMVLTEVPLRRFLEEPVIPGEIDGVSRLIFDSHRADAFAPLAHLTIGRYRTGLIVGSIKPVGATGPEPATSSVASRRRKRSLRLEVCVCLTIRTHTPLLAPEPQHIGADVESVLPDNHAVLETDG